MDLVLQMWKFLEARRKFWLLPIILVTVLIGGLFVLAQGSVGAPFLYTLFSKKILGISAYFHDAAAGLLVHGPGAGAAPGESFTRQEPHTGLSHPAIRA